MPTVRTLPLLVALWAGVPGGAGEVAFALADVVHRAATLAAQQPDPVPLAQAGRRDYLGVVAGVFEYFEQFQCGQNHSRAGAIFDPVLQQEHQYSTPCFAHAGATLLRGGWYDDQPGDRRAAVLAAVGLALNRSLVDLVEGPEGCANAHCNFYTLPIALAIRALEGIAKPETHAGWCSLLRAVDPKHSYVKGAANWRIVAAVGEQVRLSLGMHHAHTLGYIESVFGRSTEWWGPNGEFLDMSACHKVCNPTAYDHFPRYHISVALANGLNIANTSWYLELNRRAAWMSLLLQSPWGELPTGSRSSQHQWNEAQTCATFEFWAAEHAKQGDAASAKAFKRAAALALHSVRRWRRPTGDLFIVKNRVAITERHGYETYSEHSQYNLLAASMLSTAFGFADDSIREGASLAETGGFAFQTTALNKAIANAGGMYVEVELRADDRHDTFGLVRVHTTAVDPRLSVTAGVPRRGNRNGPVGVGVVWDVAEPTKQRLELVAECADSRNGTSAASVLGPNLVGQWIPGGDDCGWFAADAGAVVKFAGFSLVPRDGAPMSFRISVSNHTTFPDPNIVANATGVTSTTTVRCTNETACVGRYVMFESLGQGTSPGLAGFSANTAGQWRTTTRTQAGGSYRDASAVATAPQTSGTRKDRAVFGVRYVVPGAEIQESYTVTPSEVRVEAHLFPAWTANVTGFGVSFPAFATDGESQATVVVAPQGPPPEDPAVQARAQVSMTSGVYIPSQESCVWFEVLSAPPPACDQGKGWAWALAPERSKSRNGFANALHAKCAVSSQTQQGANLTGDLRITYRIRPCSAPSQQGGAPEGVMGGRPLLAGAMVGLIVALANLLRKLSSDTAGFSAVATSPE